MTVTYTIGFIEIFLGAFNAGLAFILLFLLGQILLIMRRVDKDLLKARLFLNDAIMQRTWVYISVSGAAFGLNSLIKLIARYADTWIDLNAYYLADITQLIFLISFIFAVYNWYVFVGSSASRRYDLR
ncbi:MAG: hypothetical protein OIN66_05215 [Candidatus Methanoperedens sp.]|nr:hypothetical protein [Candidatus Methanoperedens sp.]